jgi:hypothetical protein
LIQSATIGAKLAAQGIKSAKEAAFPFISPLSSMAQQAKSTVKTVINNSYYTYS